MMELPMRPILLAFAALAAAFLVAGTLALPRLPYLGFALRGNRVAVVDAGSDAAQAGLRVRDELRQVWVEVPGAAGAPAFQVVPARLRALPRGTSVGLIVAGPDAPARSVFFRLQSPPGSESVRRGLGLLTAATFLCVGLLTFRQRPDGLGGSFLVFCAAMSLVFGQSSAPVAAGSPAWQGLIDDWSGLLLAVSLVHFVLRFPRPAAKSTRTRVLVVVNGGAALLALTSLLGSFGPPLPAPVVPVVAALAALFVASCLAAALVVFLMSLRRAATPADAMRLRVAQWGTLLALAPLLPVVLVRNLSAEGRGLPGDQYAVLAVLILPLAYMYAIIRHQIFDVRIIVRRGVIYFLSTAALALVYFSLITFLGPALDPREGHPVVAFLSLGLIALTFTSTRSLIQQAVDRLFFASESGRRRKLTDLSGRVATMLDSERLCTTLYRDLADGMDVELAALYRADDDGRRLELIAWRNGTGLDAEAPPRTDGGGPPAVLALPGPLRGLVKGVTGPVQAEDLLRQAGDELRPGLAERLQRLGFDLFVPLRDGARLHAVVALRAAARGPNSRDLELLARISGDASQALTQARRREDEFERERLASELDVARRIQQHLLPADPPLHPLLDVAGSTHACEQVGGDSHDYAQLPDGRIGLAVGDVSGKGVPAAILMASIQASFRAEAESGKTPGPLLAALNRRLLDIAEPERFVCYFYALIDPARLDLRFANAGLEPPLLVHPDGTTEELTEGGPVLGVLAGAEYEEGSRRLVPGDVLVLFSDGLTDGPTPEETPLERSRIPGVVRANPGAGAGALRAALLAAASLDPEGAGPHPPDDVTLVVARVY